MAYGSPGPHDPGAPPREAPGVWHQEHVTSLDDALKAVETVLCGTARQGYAPEARERLRTEMEEALLSALLFSQGQDPRRPVLVAYRVGVDDTFVEVEGRARAARPVRGRGPHAPTLLQPAGEECPFGGRSYTWLRCSRHSGRLLVCKHLSVP